MDILIIKQKWLNKILHNGKCLEIRGSNTTKRGLIGLAESGTSLVKGTCTLSNSFPIKNEDQWEELKELHQVDISWEELLKRYKHPFAWELRNIEAFKLPRPYKHPQGAVIWVKGDL